MNIFQFRDELIQSYKAFSRSFTKIKSEDIRIKVEKECNDLKRYWPEPLLQINPSYKQSKTVADYCRIGKLHPECDPIFRDKEGNSIRLFVHQDQAIDFAQSRKSYEQINRVDAVDFQILHETSLKGDFVQFDFKRFVQSRLQFFENLFFSNSHGINLFDAKRFHTLSQRIDCTEILLRFSGFGAQTDAVFFLQCQTQFQTVDAVEPEPFF